MAESFSLQTSGPVLTEGARNIPAPTGQVGVAGVNFTGRPAQAPRTDPTLDVLLKLGSEILAPKIKEEQQRQYFEGVQRAAAGEALSDIIDTQPWYTQIFGPASAVQGARAYTVQASMAKFAANLEQQMPKLAEQGPEVIQQEVYNAVQPLLTGDAEADAMIQRGAAEQFAPLFKRHAREHYVFNQRKAVNLQSQTWDANSRNLQRAMSDPEATPQERSAAEQNFLMNLAPFADQTEESHQKNLSLMLRNSATAGNFHTINLFKNTKGQDGKSLWEKLPVDEQRELQAALPALARRALDEQALPKYALEINQILRDTAQNPAELPKRMAVLNAKAASEFGIYEAPMVSHAAISGAIGRVMDAQAAEAARLLSLKDDNRGALADVQVNVPNGLTQGKIRLNLQGDHVDNAIAKAWGANPDPVARAALLARHPEETSSIVKGELSLVNFGEDYHAGIGSAAATWKALPPDIAAKYYSTDAQAVFKRYNELAAVGVPPNAAWQQARLVHNVAVDSLPEDERKGIQTVIRNRAERLNETWYYRNTVDDASLRVIEGFMMKAYKGNRGFQTPEVAANSAFVMAQEQGLRIMGRVAVFEIPRANLPRLETVIGRGAEETSEGFYELLKEGAKLRDVGLDNYIVTRGGDQNGKAIFNVSATTKEGQTRSWMISSDEVLARVNKGVKPAARSGNTAVIPPLPQPRLDLPPSRPVGLY